MPAPLLALRAALLAACAPAAATLSPPAALAPSRSGEWTFSLLPRAFQNDPRIEVATITEMTPAGRRARRPTAEHPLYYFPVTGGYHDEDEPFPGSIRPRAEELQTRLQASVAQAHYLEAPHGRKGEQILVFTWGAADRLDPDTPDLDHRNLLARAALVGGSAFAHEFGQAIAQRDDALAAGISLKPDAVDRFMARSDKIVQLVEQARGDCFYVVVSAYSAAAYRQGRRELLWRTKVSANSNGVNLAQVLPTLISAGSSYFGQDMTEAATLSGHLVPAGRVDVGQPRVVPGPRQ